MHYLVIEIQVMADGTVAAIPYSFDTERAALAKYHQILAAAALSGLPKHSALVCNDEGFTFRNDCFKNEEN